MFESYLTNLLSSHFGHVFTGLSADNVAISAWRGEVVVTNLGIRRDALSVLLGDAAGDGDAITGDGGDEGEDEMEEDVDDSAASSDEL